MAGAMRDAVAAIRARAPDLIVDGEMHADAALSETIRDRIFPGSTLDGAANLLVMPNLDGISCLEKILEFHREARVVMISALGKEDLVKKALVTGAKNYIIKPLDRKKVLERIAAVLK